MEKFLEDEMLASVKRRDMKVRDDDNMSAGEEGGGGSLLNKVGVKERLSLLASNIHKETR